jgi:hypothetical protein
MTQEERLGQLELLLAEAMTVLDRHTAQLKQHTGLLNQLTTFATQQSENIIFILQEQTTMKTDLAEVKADLAGVKAQQTGMDSKLNLILDKLGNSDK